MIGKIKLMFKAWQTLREGRTLLFCCRKLTGAEMIMISEYVDGKRFMSRYHAGQKKEKVKEKKAKGVTGLKGVFI